MSKARGWMLPARWGGLDPWRLRLRARRPRFGARLIVFACLVALAGGAAVHDRLAGSDRRPVLSGEARVVDGDTLIVAGERVRFDGMDAPELSQACLRDGVVWPCGRVSAQALEARLQARIVSCPIRGRDRYGRALAHCRLGEEDLGAWMVREGLAVADTRHSWRYLPEELQARWHRRGLWAGRFEAPEAWRRAHPR